MRHHTSSGELRDRIAAGEQHLAASDPAMARLIAAHGPCTLGQKRGDPFHTLAYAIISQQLSTKAADTIAGRVHLALGARKQLRPEHFKNTDPAGLRACGLSNAKAKWLLALAEAVSTGALSFKALRNMDDDEALGRLDALPGVGIWTAEMFLIFALNHLDIFSMGDAGLRRGVNRLYNKGRKLSDTRTLKLTKRWTPYRSIASWYLWRMSDDAAPVGA